MSQAEPSAALVAGTQQPQPLGFRDASVISAGDALSFIGLTVAALAVGMFFVARRAGWIVKASATGAAPRLGVIESRRIGPMTTVHLVEADGHRMLLVESSRQVAVQPVAVSLAPTAKADPSS